MSGLAGSPALGSVDQFAPLFSESATPFLPPARNFPADIHKPACSSGNCVPKDKFVKV
ncbi:MAG: hypothetical protein R2942_02015 [Ignavibacteria bacterium]